MHDTLAEQWGPVIYEKAAFGFKGTFQYIVTGWRLESEEDSATGLIDGTKKVKTDPGEGTFDSIEALMRHMSRITNCPVGEDSWRVSSDTSGEFAVSWSGDERGVPLTDRESDALFDGTGRGWLWSLTVHVHVGRIWEPSPKELAALSRFNTL